MLPILWMHKNATQLQMDIHWKSIRTNVAKAQVDFQENPSSKLKMAQNFLNGC